MARDPLMFATTEWPPYESAKLPDNGFGIEIVRKAFQAEGNYKIGFEFFPWSRALLTAEVDKQFVGGFFAYYSDERGKKFYFSDPITVNPIVLVQRKDHPIPWQKLSDLQGKTVGVVQDYVNPPEIDKLIAEKVILADLAVDDENNIEKLAMKRTDAAVVDKYVFNYLIKRNPKIRAHSENLELNPKILELKKIYIIFRKDDEGKRLVQIFNRGLKKINVNEIIKNYMTKL
jgi:polar amino acid transport system substrate-binding protein